MVAESLAFAEPTARVDAPAVSWGISPVKRPLQIACTNLWLNNGVASMSTLISSQKPHYPVFLGLRRVWLRSIMGFCDRAKSRRALETAWDCNINFFDLARSYGYGQAESLFAKFARGTVPVPRKSRCFGTNTARTVSAGNLMWFCRSGADSRIRRSPEKSRQATW